MAWYISRVTNPQWQKATFAIVKGETEEKTTQSANARNDENDETIPMLHFYEGGNTTNPLENLQFPFALRFFRGGFIAKK